ncbi:MAG: S-adenosylmethionine uptake transporter [Sphingomonadales bacterium]|jgi:S-adenosylmethionine uptake transporter|nr:S-adenosylmethionine uptake transporter [Sphingomonadales bacterium]
MPAAFAVATLGIALFSGMDAVMKHLALALGAYNAMLWRTMAGAVFGGLVFFGMRNPWPAWPVMRIHLLRGILSSVMAILFFWGLARVPLAQGVALAFVAPLIALYLAALILKERIERRAVLASAFGFAGVLVILAAQAQAELGPEALRGSVAILFSAALYAYNIILMRQQAQVARPVEIAFFTSAIVTSCFLIVSPFFAVPPPAEHLPAIFGAAALAFASLILLSWAYARAEAQYLAPVEYTAFVWAVLLGFIVFSEPVRPLTVFGAAMIVAACLFAARRTRATDPATGV